MNRVLVALLLLAALSSTSVAQTPPTDSAAAVKAAETAGQQWLRLVDQARYGDSWEQAATMFRAVISKADWERAVFEARSPFEPFGDRTRVLAQYTTQLPNAPPGQYVLLQYQTNVAGGRRVIETVVPMLDSAQTWRVSGYFVRPL